MLLGLVYNTFSVALEFALFFDHSTYRSGRLATARGAVLLLCNYSVDCLFVLDIVLPVPLPPPPTPLAAFRATHVLRVRIVIRIFGVACVHSELSRFAFVEGDGTIVTDPGAIARHCMNERRLFFVCDLVAALPTDLSAWRAWWTRRSRRPRRCRSRVPTRSAPAPSRRPGSTRRPCRGSGPPLSRAAQSRDVQRLRLSVCTPTPREIVSSRCPTKTP